jgi:hypothetical protein
MSTEAEAQPPTATRTCQGCGLILLPDQFSPSQRDHWRPICRVCIAKRAREYRARKKREQEARS